MWRNITMQYREIESSPRTDRAPRRVMRTNLENGNGEVEWADEESDLDPSYDPDDLSASDASNDSDDSDSSGITLGSQDTDESDASDESDDSDLSGFIVDDDCIEFYSTDDEDDDEDDEDDD
jgi:hypothetical protein